MPILTLNYVKTDYNRIQKKCHVAVFCFSQLYRKKPAMVMLLWILYKCNGSGSIALFSKMLRADQTSGV